ncbi:hypothetical protein B5M42_001940 [Paenibacillus athensensis]|uniref:Uncharacterized protein n=1 Tax=Paenibacillus athensensis TaxID=1967502 RepID=A0A4Y8QAN7_9BACL|nr:hypothetical protein [Paenibacillus athensensis]MCD1257598.1 hypothetical protein [Paenibacillus athensensis]
MDRSARIEQIKQQQMEAGEIAKAVEWNWRMEQTEDQLLIHYELSHTGRTSVHVLDKVIVFAAGQGFAEAPQAMIRLAGKEQPHKLVLSRGYVSPPISEVAYELLPAARLLEPGQTLQGQARIPLPLTAWHPNEAQLPPLREVKEWELRIGLLPLFCQLEELTLEDGITVQIPRREELFLFQQWLAQSRS